jgi:hypothetical protein
MRVKKNIEYGKDKRYYNINKKKFNAQTDIFVFLDTIFLLMLLYYSKMQKKKQV